MPDRKTPPKNRIITQLPFIEPGKRLLDNGFPVYYLEGGTEEIMKIEWIFHAGSYYQQKPLTAFSAINLLKSGSLSHSADQISEILDFYGAYLSLDAQKDISSVILYVLNKNLDPVLELLREIIRQPDYPDDETRIFLDNQRQTLVINNQKMQHLARAFFAEALFGEKHPYGYRAREEDFGSISREDLLEFHHQRIHAGNGLCIVSGKIPEGLHQKLNDYFGDQQWIGPKVEKSDDIPIVPSGENKMLIHRQEALQSAIRIGRRMITRQHPDYHRVMITNALLGGFFGSRLMQNIRQGKGYTYGIHSTLVSLVRDGYFFISTQVGVNVSQLAADEIYLELKKLRSVPASSSELQVLKNYLSGNYLRSFDGPFAQGEKFKEVVIFGLNTSHFDEFLLELKNITPQMIMETASQYLHEDHMLEVIAGKKPENE